ncbi:MAG: DUF1292 domain-containing protein [Clostridia bacterium]|nr:DUF1292 domain-containing protein [Clostridia bacterium]
MADEKNLDLEQEIEELGEDMFVTLEFDDGEEECKFVALFENEDGKQYIVLDPMDGTEEFYFYGYKEVGDDEFELIDIESDEEFEAAVNTFYEILDAEEE